MDKGNFSPGLVFKNSRLIRIEFVLQLATKSD
jgi:hypothetical protein